MYVTHRSFAAPAPAIRDFFWLYTIHILYYAGVSIMPPRVLASGPKPCGGNNFAGAYIAHRKHDFLSAIFSSKVYFSVNKCYPHLIIIVVRFHSYFSLLFKQNEN